MYIKCLKLQNFKKFEEISINFHKDFNLLIGENNIGKTTIFDALLLWKMAYNSLISSDGKRFLKKSDWNSMNITFTKLQMFRIINAKDLFLNKKNNAVISVVISNDNEDFNLSIELKIPDIENSYIRFKNHKSLKDFDRLAKYASETKIKLKDMISISTTKPLSFISKQEIFYNKAIIEKYSYLGKNYDILRNKIIQTFENDKFEYLEQRLKNVTGKKFKIKFKNSRKKEYSEYIKITIQEEDKKEVDISLVGSGLIHLLEIFASLYVKEQNKKALNILLLDEPDSHIHSDLQSKLIDELEKENERQIFAITHNDRIIIKPDRSKILYFTSDKLKKRVIEATTYKELFKIRKELSQNFYELEKEFWSKIDTKNHTIFVEGISDKIILKKAIEYFTPEILPLIKIEEGGGHEFVKKRLLSWYYAETDKKAIGIFDYDEGANSSIKELQQINNLKNFKLFKLENYKPIHLINIFKKGVKIPFAIEEMFGSKVWAYFKENNLLVNKDIIIKVPFDKSLIEFLNDKDIDEFLQVYILYKVDKIYKEKVAKYIVEKIEKEDFMVFEKLVNDIKEYILKG